jgi:fructose-1,6-bisphosphatase I
MDHAAEAMRTDLMTITRHVLNEQSKFPEARGDLTILLNNIVLGCKFVCSSVSKVSQLCFVLTHQDMSVPSLHSWN